MTETDPFFVPTRSSRLNKLHSHEVIMHNSENKKVPQILNGESDNRARPTTSKTEELSMKKVRFEVFKFAQSALSAPDKQKSKIELAIKLGAKPPKNKYKNYKQLKEDKVKELQEAKRNNELYNIPIQTRIPAYKLKLNKGTLRCKRRIGSGILNVYGKVSITINIRGYFKLSHT